MTKHLRISFISLLTMFSAMAFAGSTVTFEAATDLGSSVSAGAGTLTKGGVTISSDNGILGGGQQYRFYKSSVTTFTCSAGNITKIVFTCTANGTTKYGPGCFDAQTGYTFEEDGKTGTWTGSASSITFVAGSNQVRATTIVVDIDGGGEDSGDTPQPPVDVQKVENIAAFMALGEGTEAELTLTNAKVLFAKDKDIFVKDATGAIDFYDTGIGVTTNQVLNGTIIGKYSPFRNMPELAKSDHFRANITATDGAAATPIEIGLDEVGMAFACELITLKNLTIRKDGSNFYGVSEDGDEIQIFDKFKINYTMTEGATYTITGILVPFNDSFEIAPINDFTGGSEPPAPTNTIFSETFAESLGAFTTEGELPEGLNYVWTYDSRYGAKASAYVQGTRYTTDVYLVSPLISIPEATTKPTLTFEHAANFFNSLPDEVSVNIRTEGGSWEKLTIDQYPAADWAYVTATIDLTAYIGKKVQIGFRYTSNEQFAATWEIKNVAIKGEGGSTPPDVPTLKLATIADLNTWTENTSNVQLNLNNAKVVYVDGNNKYLREGQNAVMFYNSAVEFELNSIVSGSIIVDYANYYGLHEVKDNTLTADNLTKTAATSTTLDPVSVKLSDLVALKHIADLVRVDDVNIVQEDKNYYAVKGEERVQLYTNNKSGRDNLYADKAGNGNTYTIIALFNNIYKGAPEIDPVMIGDFSGIAIIEADKQASPIYNLAGQRVQNATKGVFIQNGRKFLIK